MNILAAILWAIIVIILVLYLCFKAIKAFGFFLIRLYLIKLKLLVEEAEGKTVTQKEGEPNAQIGVESTKIQKTLSFAKKEIDSIQELLSELERTVSLDVPFLWGEKDYDKLQKFKKEAREIYLQLNQPS